MFDESILLLHTRQVKQDLCQALPAPRINSAMKTGFSHLGHTSAPPHLGKVLGLGAVPLGEDRAEISPGK